MTLLDDLAELFRTWLKWFYDTYLKDKVEPTLQKVTDIPGAIVYSAVSIMNNIAFLFNETMHYLQYIATIPLDVWNTQIWPEVKKILDKVAEIPGTIVYVTTTFMNHVNFLFNQTMQFLQTINSTIIGFPAALTIALTTEITKLFTGGNTIFNNWWNTNVKPTLDLLDSIKKTYEDNKKYLTMSTEEFRK